MTGSVQLLYAALIGRTLCSRHTDSPFCPNRYAQEKRGQHLRRVLRHEAGVQLLPREHEDVRDSHADQRGAKSNTQQLGAIARDGARALGDAEGRVARRHALERVLGAAREERGQRIGLLRCLWPAQCPHCQIRLEGGACRAACLGRH